MITKTLINNLIQQYQDIQDGKLWIGSTYASKLNEVSDTEVFTRPMDELHSIAEIISHLTLWRNETILKIKTGKGSKTDDCAENWLPNSELKKLGWKHLKSSYDQSLDELMELLKTKSDDFLTELYYDTDFKGEYRYEFVLNGMLHHDIYHLGQLGVIIKLLKQR